MLHIIGWLVAIVALSWLLCRWSYVALVRHGRQVLAEAPPIHRDLDGRISLEYRRDAGRKEGTDARG